MVSLLSALDEVSVSRDCTRKHKFSFLLAEISTYNPDVIVYHILGRTGCTVYRSAIETLGIPILGSSSDKHFITTNKVLTRAILRSAAISIAPGVELYNSTDVGEDSNAEAVSEIERKCFGGDNSGYPVVVKASTVEDSIGVFLAYDRQQLLHYIKKAFELSPEGVAVERFIAGREIRSLVIEEADGNMKILPIVEYDIGGSNNIRGTKSKIQVEDYETTGKVSCKTGSEIFLEEQPFNAKLIEAVKRESFKAFRTLQLRNFAIFDMRVDESGRPYILEVRNVDINLLTVYKDKEKGRNMMQQNLNFSAS